MTLQDPGDSFFPYNAVFVLEAFLHTIDDDIPFVRRPIKVTDANQTIAITPATAEYVKNSKEIGRQEPAVIKYGIMIQTLIIDPQQDRGLRIHSLFAKLVRELLVRDGALQVGLRDLSTTDIRGVREKSFQWEVGQQVFHTNKLEESWRYLSTLELTLETQII